MFSRKFYIKDILKIAFPMIMGNLGFIFIGVGDVIVAGRHSTDTLSAISLATAIINCIVMLGIGILTSISAILSNYRGEGKRVESYFIPSVIFALLLSVITSGLIFACIPLINKIGFEQRLIPIIEDYLFISAFSTFGAYLHCAVKEYLQSFEIVVFPNVLTIFCIFLNLILNIAFVFGYGFIPEMGAIGLAVSSLIVRYFMAIVLVIYCVYKIKISNNNDFKYYMDLVKVGLPASLAIMVEFTGFNAIAVIMGRVSGIYAAAHNILCTLTSISFMIPLAVSAATAVKVGYSNGAGDIKSLKKYAYTGILISIAFMTCSAILIGIFAHGVTELFTLDTELIKVCVPIVYVLCCYQIFDGLQVSLSGIFKGLKNTIVIFCSNVVGYWFIAIPVGCVFAFKCKFGLIGFWYSLWLSSVVLCAIMLIFMVRKFKKLGE